MCFTERKGKESTGVWEEEAQEDQPRGDNSSCRAPRPTTTVWTATCGPTSLWLERVGGLPALFNLC